MNLDEFGHLEDILFFVKETAVQVIVIKNAYKLSPDGQDSQVQASTSFHVDLDELALLRTSLLIC